MKNIFVEGLPGTGKTTLLRRLWRALPGYQIYWEGNYSPVDLEWCTYMTEQEYLAALERFPEQREEIEKNTYKEKDRYIVTYTRILAEDPGFYEYMERYEIYNGRKELKEFLQIIKKRYETFVSSGNVFECAFFQNTMKELLLYHELKEEQILDIFRDLFAPLKGKNFLMIYLWSDQIEENIERIKQERSDENGVEMWYPLMRGYLNETPYGKKHPVENVADMAAYFRYRMEMELKVIRTVLGDPAIVLPAKEYVLEDLLEKIYAGDERLDH